MGDFCLVFSETPNMSEESYPPPSASGGVGQSSSGVGGPGQSSSGQGTKRPFNKSNNPTSASSKQ